MNILPGNLRFGAGQPVKRLEDQRLLTGKGQFIDDKPEEGALWLYVLRSPQAHARILAIDTTAATASPAKRTTSWASRRRGGTVIGLPSGRMNTDSVGMVPMSSATRSAPV